MFSDADKKVVGYGVLGACDADDGVRDGMVFNTRTCDFDPASLVCSGTHTTGCLSPQQVGALEKGFAGPRNSRGKLIYR